MSIKFQHGGFPKKEYDHTIDVYNNNVHEVLMNKILKDKNSIDQEERDARELSNYFNKIKIAILNRKERPNSFIEPILTSLKKYTTFKSDKGEVISNNWLFNYLGLGTNFSRGLQFERDIAAIITETVNYVGEHYSSQSFQSAKIENFMVGSGQALPELLTKGNNFFTPEQLASFLQKDILEITNKDIEGSFKRIERDGKVLGYELLEKSGKIDVLGHNRCKIVMTEGNDLLNFFNLLEGASFTLKNYQLETIFKERGVKLGSTLFYRQFLSAMSFYNPNLPIESAETLYNASLNAFYLKDDVEKHLNHIRILYELAGAGLTYNGINLGVAKYLIVNTRKSSIGFESKQKFLSNYGDIAVYSIRSIIRDYLENSSGIEIRKNNKTKSHKVVFTK